MTDQPTYPSYLGSDGSGDPVPPAPVYGQEPPAYGQAPPNYGSVPPPPPGFPAAPGGYGPPPGNNPKAVWALVLGILSITCCGFFTGIAAIVLGSSAKKEIAASGGRQSGEGMATAGFVTGIIGSVLGVLMIALFVLGLVADA